MFHTPAHKNLVTPGACIVPAATPECDFRYVDHGSIIILTAVTPAAKAWLEASDRFASYASWGKHGVAVERRQFGDVLDAIDGDGLYFAPEGR